MLYFIPWVVFLLGVIIAFVVTMVMGKPKQPKSVAAPVASESAAPMDDAPAEEVATEPAFEEVRVQNDAVDDFAAFDQDFK